MEPIISYSEVKYKQVEANTTDDSDGIVIPNGETHFLYRIRSNGADPSCYVIVCWDWESEKRIFSSSRGEVDIVFDSTLSYYQFTGDGVKKLNVIIINDNDSMSPYIGGSVEVVKLG
jgi:hypothetical protein